MAAPGGRFSIQDALYKPAIHHQSFEQLWITKWKIPCKLGIYPFMFGAYKDFEPIAAELIKQGQKEPYDWDAYAREFFPTAEALVNDAEKAEHEGHREKASELYLRGSAVYRISRFPAPRSQLQRIAWERGKDAARKGLGLRERPVREIVIPHTHGLESEGIEIPFYYHLPPGASQVNQVPLVIILTGLDGYRTELAVWAEGWSRINVATIILEIPGTGDSPADPSDPRSPDREWSSLLEWVDKQPELDYKRRAVWGFSTGGYYAIRLAHTHAYQFSGVVALGGGCHYMFHPEWLTHVNALEYPFDLATALAHKFGYGSDLETFKREAMGKFSLLQDGTLDSPVNTNLLLVNGLEDEIFPIDDYYMCLQHGAPKQVRLIPDRKHMGEPESFAIILEWLYQLFGIVADPAVQLKTIPSRTKY